MIFPEFLQPALNSMAPLDCITPARLFYPQTTFNLVYYFLLKANTIPNDLTMLFCHDLCQILFEICPPLSGQDNFLLLPTSYLLLLTSYLLPPTIMSNKYIF